MTSGQLSDFSKPQFLQLKIRDENGPSAYLSERLWGSTEIRPVKALRKNGLQKCRGFLWFLVNDCAFHHKHKKQRSHSQDKDTWRLWELKGNDTTFCRALSICYSFVPLKLSINCQIFSPTSQMSPGLLKTNSSFLATSKCQAKRR